jgi:hypothetical protein
VRRYHLRGVYRDDLQAEFELKGTRVAVQLPKTAGVLCATEFKLASSTASQVYVLAIARLSLLFLIWKLKEKTS